MCGFLWKVIKNLSGFYQLYFISFGATFILVGIAFSWQYEFYFCEMTLRPYWIAWVSSFSGLAISSALQNFVCGKHNYVIFNQKLTMSSKFYEYILTLRQEYSIELLFLPLSIFLLYWYQLQSTRLFLLRSLILWLDLGLHQLSKQQSTAWGRRKPRCSQLFLFKDQCSDRCSCIWSNFIVSSRGSWMYATKWFSEPDVPKIFQFRQSEVLSLLQAHQIRGACSRHSPYLFTVSPLLECYFEHDDIPKFKHQVVPLCIHSTWHMKWALIILQVFNIQRTLLSSIIRYSCTNFSVLALLFILSRLIHVKVWKYYTGNSMVNKMIGKPFMNPLA